MPAPAKPAPAAPSTLRVGAPSQPSATSDGRPRIAPAWEPQEDGRVALMFPASFAVALRSGPMVASSTGKSVSPVVLLKPPLPLIVDREDGEETTFDLTCAVFAKLGAGSVRI